MRFLLLAALALCVSGCGGCVDEGSDQQPPRGSTEPSPPTHAVGPARALPRIAHLPNASAIRDSGAGDE